MGRASQTYACEYCKKAPRRSGYPRRYQWKTERGFNNHSCYKNEQAAEEQRRLDREREKERFVNEVIPTLPHKVGDEVHYVYYVVTKPIYEQRGTRRVKVRYEEERRYMSAYDPIASIEPGFLDMPFYVCGGFRVSEKDIFSDGDTAEAEAQSRQKSYDEAREFASYCR